MDDLSDDSVEKNWIFIETVDIAEEAIVLNTTGVSETQESDVESDGISIISNWSCSPGTSDLDHLEDNLDETLSNETIQDNPLHSSESKTFDQEINNIENDKPEIVAGEHNQNEKEDLQNSMAEKIPADCLVESNTSLPLLYPDHVDDIDLVDQLKSVDEPPKQENNYNLPTYLTSKIHLCIKKHFNFTGFLVWTVLIAVSSAFLGKYFTGTEHIQEEIPTYQKKVILYDVPGQQYFAPSTLSFCREKHKSDDIYIEINTKKCLAKIDKNMRMKNEEKISNERKNKGKKTRKYFIEGSGQDPNVIKDNLKKKDKDEKTLKKKQYDSKKLKKLRKENSIEQKPHKKKHTYKKCDHLYKEKSKTERHFKCDSKREDKLDQNKFKDGIPSKVLPEAKKNETVDGYWLEKMFKGRKDLRTKENSGEWYFDRSFCRTRKRDKAKWYFDWMMDRELLRYKKLYSNF